MSAQFESLMLGDLVQVRDTNNVPVLCEFIRFIRFSDEFEFVALDDNITYSAHINRLADVLRVAGSQHNLTK